VTGDLLEVGGRVTLTAYLHDTAGATVPLQQASAEGQTGDLFDIVDGLVADLLAGSMSAPTDRLQKLAVATSHSLEATKEYLRGERLLRQGRYREAGAAYDQAVTLDPGFALAHYRKSLAADWTDAYDVRSSAERALELADHLSPRDRNLLSALILRRTGQNRRAEQAYRAHLHTYPDDVEALLQLGEVFFHDNPRWGVDMLESLGPFTEAVELEPVNSNARIHLARLYALMGDLEALRATADIFAEESADSERSVEVDAIYAVATGDSARMQTVMDRIRESPSYFAFYAAHGADRFVRDAHAALRILDDSGHDDDVLLGTKANLLAAQGRYRELMELIEGLPGGATPTWDLYTAFILTSGAVPATPERLESLLDRVRRIDPAESLETAWLPPYEDLTEAYARFERDYHAALLMIQLGRVDEAREVMDAMALGGELPGLGSIATDGLEGLEAEIHLQAGDSAQALEALRSLSFEVTHASSVRPFPDQARARLLLAELEWRFGDVDVAAAYLQGLDESWGLWDTPFRPLAYRLLGEIAESRGRLEEATLYYELLVELWARCDPELVPQREEIQARLDRIRRG
jgi:tetratricopeptide (TPR) repeat protein